MKKQHGIWIGVFTGLLHINTNDLAFVVVGLPLAIYIVVKFIDLYRVETNPTRLLSKR